jgi:drug/metabolite transporter (DMT)-like permease
LAAVTTKPKRLSIIAGLLAAVALWGGNNAGVKFLVHDWPPLFTGSTRFLCAGLLMFGLLRWTRWLGTASRITPETNRRLWLRGGLGLAAYVALFNLALRFTAASHVALYLAASPVWALLWEGSAGASARVRLKRGGAAALALSGVAVLFWPTLHASGGSLTGEVLGLTASVLWTHYGRQCRELGGAGAAGLSGAEIAAHTMWRAGVLLLPFALLEATRQPPRWSPMLLAVQGYCIIAGGILAFALWNHALRHWKTSEVYLFNNLIPLSTAIWAHFCLRETISPTFWPAMVLIVAGVLAGQADWQRLLGRNWVPEE